MHTLRRVQLRGSVLLALACIAALLLAATVAAYYEPDALDQEDLIGPCLEDDPYNLKGLYDLLAAAEPARGEQMIHRYLTAEFVGRGNLMEAEPTIPREDATEPPNTGEEPEVDEARYGMVEWSVFNAATLNQFHVKMQQPMLDDIRGCHEESGRTSATEGVDDPGQAERDPRLFFPAVLQSARGALTSVTQGRALPAGWSNGFDTRIIRTPTTLWPWRTISQFRYGNKDESRCTGTLIGPRHLITAAHCINEKGTNNWYTVRVAPAKNGVGVEPYGSSVISIPPAAGATVWYFTPWQWRNPATASSQWDWGLIVIPDRLGDQTGWMGYVAMNGSKLKSVNNYNRGYPLCDTDRNNQPSNCQDSRLYGDLALCGIGNFYSPGPDGWNRRISVSCDMSAGHSGSAVYNYFFDTKLGKWVPVVAMMAITESCTTCTLFDFYPNVARRITPGDLGTISWLRETFP